MATNVLYRKPMIAVAIVAVLLPIVHSREVTDPQEPGQAKQESKDRFEAADLEFIST